MTSVQHHGLDGSRFVIEARDLRVDGPTTSSVTFGGSFGELTLRSGSADHCRKTVTLSQGAQLTESFGHGSGTLEIGRAESYDNDDFQLLGIAQIALWTSGDVAVWARSGQFGEQWMLDVFSQLDMLVIGTDAVVRPKSDSLDLIAGSALTKSIGDGGVVRLAPYHLDIAPKRPAHGGARVAAGEAYARKGDGSAYIFADTVTAAVDHIRDPDEVARIVDNLRDLSWAA